MVSTTDGHFSWLRCRTAGVEAVAADTARHFGRHAHEQYGIGLIERGAQKSASGRGLYEAGAGDLIMVNPGELHDGMPLGDGGRAWRMLYLEPSVVAGLMADMDGAWPATGFEFRQPAVRDPRLAACFQALYRRMTGSGEATDALDLDEALLQLLGGAASSGEGGVAFWAHVGGFVAGAVLIQLFKDPGLVRKHRALAQYV